MRTKSFRGGYRFRNFSGQPQFKILSASIPRRVVIPLDLGYDPVQDLMVKPGDSVRAGQVLARDNDRICSPIHATVNGTVEAIESQAQATIVIESDGSQDWLPLEGFSSDWRSLPAAKIEELLYLSGVASLNRRCLPTGLKSFQIQPDQVEHVIVHHTQSDIFNHSLEALWQDQRFDQSMEGLEIIQKVYANAITHLVMSSAERKWLKRIEDVWGKNRGVRIHAVKPKYPQGFAEVLIPTILDSEYPEGRSSKNSVVIVLDFLAIHHAYEAVALGKPLIERMITLCGPCFEDGSHLNVRIGTTVDQVISGKVKEDGDFRLLWDSVLTGDTIEDTTLPVTRETTSIIALPEGASDEFLPFARPGFKHDSFSNTFLSKFLSLPKTNNTNIHGERRACISCSFCSEVCPVGIYPQLLHRYVERDIIDERLLQYKIFECIDCNLCSYVCTSKIDLASLIRKGKERLKKEGYISDEIPEEPKD